jgi:hypothetical protein
VVLVITDAEVAPLPPVEFELQPLHTAAETTAATVAARADRTPLSGTAPTLTSGQVKPLEQAHGRTGQKPSPAYYDSL